MTPEELREATKEFDEDFVFERAKALTPEMKARWERTKNKTEPTTNGKTKQTIAVRLDEILALGAALRSPRRNASAGTP